LPRPVKALIENASPLTAINVQAWKITQTSCNTVKTLKQANSTDEYLLSDTVSIPLT